MKREFEIVYQEQSPLTIGEAAADGVAVKFLKGSESPAFFPHGDLKTVRVTASVEKEARKMVGAAVHIVSISQVRVVIDLNQTFFRVEEAAEYLRCGVSTIYGFMEDGTLPRAKDGNPIFHRKQLDDLALKVMTKVDFRKAA